VAEVDEAAFEELRNYDESPRGILLPEDQQLAMDSEGNIYFQVRYRSNGQYQVVGQSSDWLIYRVPLDKSKDDEDSREEEASSDTQKSFSQHYGPVFLKVSENDHEHVSGESPGE
jgi:hypothetical protein